MTTNSIADSSDKSAQLNTPAASSLSAAANATARTVTAMLQDRETDVIASADEILNNPERDYCKVIAKIHSPELLDALFRKILIIRKGNDKELCYATEDIPQYITQNRHTASETLDAMMPESLLIFIQKLNDPKYRELDYLDHDGSQAHKVIIWAIRHPHISSTTLHTIATAMLAIPEHRHTAKSIWDILSLIAESTQVSDETIAMITENVVPRKGYDQRYFFETILKLPTTKSFILDMIADVCLKEPKKYREFLGYIERHPNTPPDTAKKVKYTLDSL